MLSLHAYCTITVLTFMLHLTCMFLLSCMRLHPVCTSLTGRLILHAFIVLYSNFPCLKASIYFNVLSCLNLILTLCFSPLYTTSHQLVSVYPIAFLTNMPFHNKMLPYSTCIFLPECFSKPKASSYTKYFPDLCSFPYTNVSLKPICFSI
jgi:hypothetical protein